MSWTEASNKIKNQQNPTKTMIKQNKTNTWIKTTKNFYDIFSNTKDFYLYPFLKWSENFFGNN